MSEDGMRKEVLEDLTHIVVSMMWAARDQIASGVIDSPSMLLAFMSLHVMEGLQLYRERHGM